MKTPAVGVALAIAVYAPSAFAQKGPSFDCAKASNASEKAICADPELAKADRAMAAAYAVLLAKLGEQAKLELTKDQEQWIAARNRACATDSAGLAPCLGDRYDHRTDRLKSLVALGDHPFVATRYLRAGGKRGKVSWSYDISYPQFIDKTADFSALDAQLAAKAKKASEQATPGNDAGLDREQEWTYEQDFSVDGLGPRAFLLTAGYNGFSGGAHPYGASDCMLVDRRTGKAVSPQGTFALGNHWLEVLVPLVTADLKHQFEEKPGFDEVLQPAKMSKLLHEPSHYCWKKDSLDLSFNQYEVGPYVSGPFDVEIPMATLKPLFATDGPLAELR